MRKGLERLARLYAQAKRPPPDLLPSKWAERNYVITKGPAAGKFWSCREGWEFQRGILDGLYGPMDPGEEIREGVVFKGAKAGITMICDIGAHYWASFRHQSAAIVAPRKPDSADRAQESERTIMASPFLRKAFSHRKGRTKQALHGAQLIFRSAETERDAVDWGAMVINSDEEDHWKRGLPFNIRAMLSERQGGYPERISVSLSTPTIPDFGVHKLWLSSDKRYYFIRCQLHGCKKIQRLTWPDNIAWNKTASTHEAKVKSARFICKHCGRTWNRFDRMRANMMGEWVAEEPSRDRIGYGISRLYVPTAIPREFVDKWLKGQTDPTELREFWNQKMGLPFLSTLGDLDSAAVQRCITSIPWGKPPTGYTRLFAGVDVQGEEMPLQYPWEVRAFNDDNEAALIAYGIAHGEDEIVSVLNDRYGPMGVQRALIDMTDGHHRMAVESLVRRIPCLEAARFDPWTKVKFQRVKRERAQQARAGNMSGWVVEREAALDDCLVRFFEQRGKAPTIQIARNPRAGREKELIKHYTGIRREREETKDGPRYIYKKKRQEAVDYPFAGALAEVARAISGAPEATGAYGKVSDVAKTQKKKGKARPSKGKPKEGQDVFRAAVVRGKGKRRLF